ncbi:NAD-dependent deacylase [Chitinophaga pendula]|uniref:Sir2 family NAD-dependent protein deacetylase n=1 Tax=Chitinophaga TaxID=79328 RepID=UPI000BB08987|nr:MULTISPECIES: Sir2 family NAD-dependent protein deacetylase [Chitinophaga]ASZ12851.1 NAD-dependent protein deacylase [Chitinophaga sp. MD30]UCJ09522.1 NAD-dependent deacylase [Chitinophaga pendula]
MQKKKLIVLSGAGISAESGLRTFRDSDGLWEGYNVYEVASPIGWNKDPQLVLDFYNMRRRDVKAAQPNAAHIGLAQLETLYDVCIVTQNIDNLHERGGSSNVLHLHGEIFQMRSVLNEQQYYPIEGDIMLGDLAADGGQLRPHIVWFGEPVTMIEKAAVEMMTADVFVLIGTSMNVYPAAGLMDYVRPEVPKYVIDKKIPPVSHYENLIAIEKPATEGVAELCRLLGCG